MADRIADSMRRGLEQAVAHGEGRGRGVRLHRVEPMDVKAIRDLVGLTQEQFSVRIGISLATLQQWERGDRQPHGTARVLLAVISRSPKEVMRAIDGTRRACRPSLQRRSRS